MNDFQKSKSVSLKGRSSIGLSTTYLDFITLVARWLLRMAQTKFFKKISAPNSN